NGLLLLIWLATVAISAARLARVSGNRPQNLFNLVLLIPLVMYAVSKESSSPTSDLPHACVAFAAASTFVRLLSARSESDPAEISFMTVTVILLATVALCIKLSAGALAASMGLLALTVYLIRTPHSPWRRATIIWSCG